MAKPKAPAWLCEAFRDGVDDREMVYRDGVERFRKKQRPYAGANPWCWLAQFDSRQLPCGGQPGKVIERFHFIPRQRVENALGALLPTVAEILYFGEWSQDRQDRAERLRRDLILLAAWDSRNGGLGCEGHHRRLDSQATPALSVPRLALPTHVEEFAADWGLESPLEDRFR